MRRWFGFFLALVLSLSVVMPARLHAMAQHHSAHAVLAHDCEGEHSDMPTPLEHRQHALCIAACACLPVSLLPPGAFTPAQGQRLVPLAQADMPSREPDLLLKPPKNVA